MLAGDDKELRAKAIDAANKPYTPPPAPPSTPSFTRSEPTLDGPSMSMDAPPMGQSMGSAPAMGSSLEGKRLITPKLD